MDSDVALVVAQLASYGHEGECVQTFEALAADFPQIVPGGLAAVDRLTTVVPSCCCGLESWRDWYELLRGGESPWLGHSPSPWVEKTGDEFVVWPDGGLGEPSDVDVRPVRLSRSELVASLEAVECDLRAFALRLGEWVAARAPEQAPAVVAGFRALAKLC